ncbi:RING-H2 finger protein ATL8-like [Pieris brassicae]|uniref:RING-type domain-containing protein n=1 Tax=Pieris brassicae TaxID=7116 RepID=A0A9P0TFA6_PIEBR|nr:RING-H2 finger protein ATL8-like [Pieris brassicae]CAH4031157.1 unnamed protein product [Pieris brassicae]
MADYTTIDLTNSLCLVNHNALSNLIIELDDTDESFSGDIAFQSTPIRAPSKKLRQSLIKKKKLDKSPENTPDSKIGECSICCERLGKRPVSSTICGHIFCTACIETALRHDKRCPQCRKTMKGAYKYHPIYIPLESK